MLKVTDLKTYIDHGFNVLLQGLHGTGKTSMLMEACKSGGYTFAQFNAAILDPYTELVGIPKVDTDENGKDVLKMVRPELIDANVIFIDELNRGEPRTLSACMELIQFRSINGELLPNLKAVIAAQNPPGGEYNVDPLDPALVDRFHIVLEVTPNVNLSYLVKTFGNRAYARALKTWYDQRDNKKTDYLSPRRLEYLGDVFMKTRSREALEAAMPPAGTFPTGKLFEMLTDSLLSKEEREAKVAKTDASMERLAGARKAEAQNSIENILRDNSDPKRRRRMIRATDPNELAKFISSKKPPRAEFNAIIDALASNISPERLFTHWAPVLNEFSDEELCMLTGSWRIPKRTQARSVYYTLYAQNRPRVKNILKAL